MNRIRLTRAKQKGSQWATVGMTHPMIHGAYHDQMRTDNKDESDREIIDSCLFYAIQVWLNNYIACCLDSQDHTTDRIRIMTPERSTIETMNNVTALATEFRHNYQRIGLRLLSLDGPTFATYRHKVASCMQQAYTGVPGGERQVNEPVSYIDEHTPRKRFCGLLLLDPNDDVVAGHWSAEPPPLHKLSVELQEFIHSCHIQSAGDMVIRYIYQLFVHPAYKRQNLGTGLGATAIDTLIRANHSANLLVLSRIVFDDTGCMTAARRSGRRPTGIYDHHADPLMQYWYGYWNPIS